ncbi:hypothetical protein [Xanthomonas tesorieronis]|uniref:hypothetical protein n=1 Tax=Xanthomonas tesorieronis TaxID=3160839 RepID=UPI003512E21E
MKMLAVTCLVVSSLVAAPAYAGDPCATLMCMSGKLVGAGLDQSCAGPMTDYFKIVRFDRHGYNPNKTSDARQSYLNSCTSAGDSGGYAQKVNEKFGKMRLGF